MKTLWNVAIESEVLVLAETREEAEREARHATKFDLDPDYHASPMSSMPYGWDGGEIPYGSEDDKTVDECIAEGAAESYRKMMENLKAARAARQPSQPSGDAGEPK